MALLAADPVTLDAAGSAVVSVGCAGLGSVVSTLTTALSGTAGMAGDDPAGGAFGRSYDSSASKLLEAMATARNGLCRLGDGVRMSAHNYSLAEALSDISGHSAALPVPPSTGSVSAGSAPSAVGNAGSAPGGWGWVAPYLGMIWPTGDSGRLRTAAAAWNAAGTKFAVDEILGSAAPMNTIRAQQLPEGAQIDAGFSDAFSAITGIAEQCQAVATQLTVYATKIDTVHAAVLDLLARICNPLTGLKEVWEFFTDQDEDEIKKIADDIRTIIDSFTDEVDALCGQIAAVFHEATAMVTTMATYADKEWDQFQHGTDVGRVINQLGQVEKGAWSEVGGMVKQAWTFSEIRALVDPEGFWHSLQETAAGIAPLIGAGGAGAPGVDEAWKELGKETVHWDEWSKNPAEAAGRSAVDLATAFLPGGPASKLAKLARDAVKGVPPRPPHTEPPKALPPPHEKPAPPADGGRPAPAPPDSPAPHSPTETKPPVAEKAAAAEPSRVPAAAPPDHPRPTHLAPPEAMPVRAPASPTAGQLPYAAPFQAPSAPHTPAAPAPHSPAGGVHPPDRPPEPPSPQDGDHHDHLPKAYTPSDVGVDAAHQIYQRAAAAEPQISSAVADAVRDAGGQLEKFESRLKEIDSIARKIDDLLEDVNLSDLEEMHAAENEINDAVRYTVVVNDVGYWSHGDAVIKALEERGFTLTYDPGGWEVPNAYRGRNLTFATPDGMKFEVQVHTGDSLSAAEQTRGFYEEERLRTTSQERVAELRALKGDIFKLVAIPDGTPLIWKDP